MTDLIGTVVVDSGIVLVGDPCFAVGGSEGTPESWSDFVAKVFPDRHTIDPEPLGEGKGLAVPVDDGEYAVYVERDGVGNAKRLVVELDRRIR